MVKYTLTNKAVGDISKIWEYTYEVWSEAQADNYYQLIIRSCQAIANSPLIGKKYDKISIDILGFGVGKHIIFYRILKTKHIEIIRILHQRMDFKNRLKE